MKLDPGEALLLTNATNIRYLTGFQGLSSSGRESYLLLTEETWYLFTFELYRQEAEELCRKHAHIEIQYITPEKKLPALLADISFQKLKFEERSLTYKEFSDIKAALPATQLLPDTQTVEHLRRKKSEQEITFLQQAASLTDACFFDIQKQITKDMKEEELAWNIERYIREHGAQLSFPPIVAFNTHSSLPHYVPAGNCTLTADSIILLDFGAKVHGYHADMTRMIFFGTPKEEWVKAYETVKQAQDKALQYLSKEGSSGSTADEIARKVITDAGYPVYPHALGHGTGLEIHEHPRLSIHRDTLLEQGMVFTIEPAIYLPGNFGIRIEDLVLKTKDGIDVLSKAGKDIIIL